MTTITNRLFSEFPEVSTSRWEEKILADLKGKDYEKVLIWRTQEGFSVKPHYRAEDLEGKEFLNAVPGEFPYVRGTRTTNDWLIRQDIKADNLAEANKKALDALGKGVSSLGFIFDGCPSLTATDLAVLLKDICLEAAEINIVCPCSVCDVASAFTQYVKTLSINPENIKASVSCDPLSASMLTGTLKNIDQAFEKLSRQVKTAAAVPGLRTVAVNGKHFGNSGSSIVQELAFSLAMGAECLDRLTGHGLSPDESARAIKFNFSISNNYFLEIAKLRAGRMLWSKIAEAWKPEHKCSTAMVTHCETGRFNKSVYDPYVNLLRTQTEAMSAALGGADSITVEPFDAIFQAPGDFSERIARNQQILLKEESNFDKVTDIAGGSYYIESLTDSIAEQAWKLFLAVEGKGGFSAALKEGFIQKEVKEMASKRSQNIALRRENLLGVNQFPNFTEAIKTEIDNSVFSSAAVSVAESEIETIVPFRGAQPFEALRYKTDQYAMTHKRPTAFMLTIGNLAMRKARAQFSCNFFAVAGFEVIDNNGFSTLEEGFAAARSIGAEIIVVCSSDEEYAEMIPQLSALKGEETVVIAGNPACRPDFEAAGYRNFIHVRSNLLEELKNYQRLLMD